MIFAESYALLPDGTRRKNYYVSESVGIATGLLIAALHHAGLASLTHTPSPMRFPEPDSGTPEERAPVSAAGGGVSGDDARVPVIRKKTLREIATFTE